MENRQHDTAKNLAFRTVAVLALLLLASVGLAQDNDEASVDVRFWAFSSNPQFFAYQTTNHLGDRAFVVGQVGSPEPAFLQSATEDLSPRDILISQEVRDTYGWNSNGTEGITSPSGFTEIVARETGGTVSITARQGSNAHPVGAITRLTDDAQTTYAALELKTVMWSDDETVAVVVLEQSLAGSWPLRVQTAHGFMIPERPEAAPAPTTP